MRNLLLLAAASLLLTLTTAAQKAGDINIEPYTFETNKGQKIEAEFGTIYVPEKHSEPNRKLIKLAFVRFKSAPNTFSFPIVYLAGGPGGSGVSSPKIKDLMREFMRDVPLSADKITLPGIRLRPVQSKE